MYSLKFILIAIGCFILLGGFNFLAYKAGNIWGPILVTGSELLIFLGFLAAAFKGMTS